MRKFTLSFMAICCLSLFASAQVSTLNPAGTPVSVSRLNFVNEDFFVYMWLNGQTMHFVWDELAAHPVNFYVVEQSKDGVNYYSIDSVSGSASHFDIFRNNYPTNISYENNILYSTETGNGRF